MILIGLGGHTIDLVSGFEHKAILKVILLFD